MKFSTPSILSLTTIVESITTLHQELAFVRQQELDAELQAYISCTEPSMEARKRAAKYAAAPYTKEIFRLEAQLQTYIEFKYLTIRLLDISASVSSSAPSSASAAIRRVERS